MFWNKTFASVFLVLITMSYSFGQECKQSFRGVIKDKSDKSPIIEAIIQIEGTDKYVTSDTNGNFVISNLCKKDYWLVITHVSYSKRRIEINTSTNSFSEILLSTDQQELDEVTIKA